MYAGTEYFKKVYADAAGEETFHNNKTLIYLGASASAEFFADLGLCPLEAVKVRAGLYYNSPGDACKLWHAPARSCTHLASHASASMRVHIARH